MHHLISQFSTNVLVAQSSIFYDEHWRKTLTFQRYVLYKKSNLGKFLSWFNRKNQRVLINRRKSLIFTPQNIVNPEKYRIHYQQNSYSICWQGVIIDSLTDSFHALSVTQLVLNADTQEWNFHLISWPFFKLIVFMYDVIIIPIIIKLTQYLESLFGKRPIHALLLFYFCLRHMFCPMGNHIFIN